MGVNRGTRLSRAGVIATALGMLSLAVAACGTPSTAADAALGASAGVGPSAVGDPVDPVDAEATNICRRGCPNCDYVLPGYELADWVSYADWVGELTVEAETVIPPDPEDVAIGEGLVGRRVTVKRGETIWANPERPSPPESFSMGTWGWLLQRDAEMVEFDICAPRFEVGGRYIAAMTIFLPPAWAPLTGRSVLAVPGDAIAEQDIADKGHDEVAQMLAGKSNAEIRAILDATAWHPAAQANAEMPAELRYARVVGPRL